MNSPQSDDPALTSWAQNVPPPILRATARQRSLDAALAALEPASPPVQPQLPQKSPILAHQSSIPAPRRLLRFSRAHLTGLAACWALAAYFHLSAPRAPENPGTSPAAGYAAWPGAFHPAPDEETAKLLATLYPGRTSGPFPFPP